VKGTGFSPHVLCPEKISGLYRLRKTLYVATMSQGTSLLVPKTPHFELGFSPCGLWLIAIRLSFSVFPQPL
jgi:hypothetical protein